MLFYESAKCLHGRRSQLKGKNYGSIFVHYQPVDQSIWDYSVDVSSLHALSFFLYFVSCLQCGALGNIILGSLIIAPTHFLNMIPTPFQEVIANVPPHWNEGILENHGSRWAGQVLTMIYKSLFAIFLYGQQFRYLVTVLLRSILYCNCVLFCFFFSFSGHHS